MRMQHEGRGFGPREGRRGGRGFAAQFGSGGFNIEFGAPGSRGGRGGRFGGRGGFGGDGFGDANDFGRPRGRRRMFGSGELRLVLLRLIADEPRHGYDLIRAIEEKTGGQYAPSPGVVYPTLTMLQDMGLIDEQAAEGSRKAFAATDEGRAHLAENEAEVTGLLERLDQAKPREGSDGGPKMGRAIGNLMAALRNRVAHDGVDDALIHEITAILDDAAQRIERLK